MFEKYLREIGLSEKESAVYVALLSFDKASVVDISKKASLKRPTTYVILESLSKKGLVSEANIGKKTFYIAEPPEKLALFVERQIHLLEENKKSLDIIVPQLKSIQREQGEKPLVQFFEGKEGILSSHSDIFSSKIDNEPLYNIFSTDMIVDFLSEKEKMQLREERISKGIFSRAIYTSKNTERPSDSTGERLRIDYNKYPISTDISIYGDKVRISILGKRPSGISIKSKELAETMKSLVKYIFDHK
jgi:sugar-specific transcriptional regulator TrmB